MPQLQWISVPEEKWKTTDESYWDGKSVVWLNNENTKTSIQIPVFKSIYYSYVGAVIPSYAPVNIAPQAPKNDDQFSNPLKYVAYDKFNESDGIGSGSFKASLGEDKTSLYVVDFSGDASATNMATSGSSGTMPLSVWETTGAASFFVIKDDSPDSINGYSLYYNTGFKIIDGEIINQYAPSKNLVKKSWFINGLVGYTITKEKPQYDPFNPGGNSGTGGGGGDFDNTSTPIEIPNLPSVSAASTGFISLFNPTLSQLNELASYMWSDIFDIDTLKKLFADPMDVILGLSILPVQIPTSGEREVKVGNIGTGISLNVASTQFVEVDCGTINVNEYWGAYLDYSPYTHAQIYLPYVGVRPISVDEIMGKSVNVNYHVDILTGACCCFVKCGDSVLYSFNGQCSIPIPISATNYTNTINGIINVAASLGTMVATGGATAPLAAATLASTITNQMKPTVEKSGAISGPGGVMGIQTPYLILTRPRQALPSKQNEFIGYPSFITVTLGELSGYTEVHSVHLENIPATADELSEIETLLKGGVIF